ncbi:FxLYD domain-containing protein [Crateriforma conspicua]|nr:FxLYD domain-containing protein [Crateriforma conspicua]
MPILLCGGCLLIGVGGTTAVVGTGAIAAKNLEQQKKTANTTASTSTAAEEVPESTNSPKDPRVEAIFLERNDRYQEELQEWSAAKDAMDQAQAKLKSLNSELSEIQSAKPIAPVFERREWVTVDEKYKTAATLVDTDNVTVTLRRTDGQEISVPKKELIAESRIYVEESHKSIASHREKLQGWEESKSSVSDQIDELNKIVGRAKQPKPTPPSRESIAAELENAAAAEREKQRLAKLELEREEAEREARIAEEELNVDGLVLMRNSVSGTTNEFGITVKGVVENRRNRKLSYAQITFNIYDSSGAQVGSAAANINGLEAGGRWKFEAHGLTEKGTSYKFSELSGF